MNLFLASLVVPFIVGVKGDGVRMLQTNLTAAQETVYSEVNAAMNSNVSGLALAINYVRLTPSQGGEQQMAIGLKVPGATTVQQMLIDTGSSTTAFCDSTIASNSAEQSLITQYSQCNPYSGVESCTSDGQGGFHQCKSYINNYPQKGNDGTTCTAVKVFWGGSVYQGDITVYQGQNETEVGVIKSAYYAVIQEKGVFYACDTPLNGIFGVAFKSLNMAYNAPGGSASLTDVLCQTDIGPLAVCNTQGLSMTNFDAPIQTALKDSVQAGQSSAETFGIYVDYEAAQAAPTGDVVSDVGILFGGNLAYDNTFFNSGPPLTANGAFGGGGQLQDGRWWDLNLQKIYAPAVGLEQTYQAAQCTSGNCIADSGTSYLFLPLDPSVCNNQVPADQMNQTLYIDLESNSGGTITLEFPLSFIVQQAQSGWIECTGTSGSFVLGMPTFRYYYLLYDMTTGQVTFVKMNSSTPPTTTTGGFDPNNPTNTSGARTGAFLSAVVAGLAALSMLFATL